jgi:hypothetical protein
LRNKVRYSRAHPDATIDSRSIPTDRDTGFNEPLSTIRNTTLPHPNALQVPEVTDQEALKSMADRPEHVDVGFATKVKAEIEIVSGKILCNPHLVEKGRALKHGVVEK